MKKIFVIVAVLLSGITFGSAVAQSRPQPRAKQTPTARQVPKDSISRFERVPIIEGPQPERVVVVERRDDDAPPRLVAPLSDDNVKFGREVPLRSDGDNYNNGDPIFTAVEKPAEFPGGIQMMMKWLGENVHYPEVAHDNGVEGRSIVKFVVERDGSISNVQIVKGADMALDREALRVVSSMPRWVPGSNSGEPVRSYFTIPITFKLNQDPAGR